MSFADATRFPGCFAYDAAEDFDSCKPCTGTDNNDDMAGMGSDCMSKVENASSCLADGRVDSVCCNDSVSGTACQFKPGLHSGAVCCRTSTTANHPTDIAAVFGPDPFGNLWIAASTISRVSTVARFQQFSPDNRPGSRLTVGPDHHKIWWIRSDDDSVTTIGDDGRISGFRVGDHAGSQDITAGADGNFWILHGDAVVAMSTSGTTVHTIPLGANAQAVRIISGLDGNIWFTESGANKVGRIIPPNAVTEFVLPSCCGPFGITTTADGSAWYVQPAVIGRIPPGGSPITEYHPDTPLDGEDITLGPDGNLWITAPSAHKIWRFIPPIPTATPTATPTASRTPTRTRSPTPSRTPTLTITATPTRTATGTTTVTPTMTIRATPSVPAQALLRCQHAISAGAAKLAGLELQAMQACGGGAFGCVQTKVDPMRASCVARTATKCAKSLAKVLSSDLKFAAALERMCGGAPPKVPPVDLLGNQALGFGSIFGRCVAPLGADVYTGVATCLAARDRQQADGVADVGLPRTTELLELMSPPVVLDDLCLPIAIGPGGTLVTPVGAGTTSAKCARAVQTATAKFVKQRLRLVTSCAQRVLGCDLTTPPDAACLGKAQAACAKSFATLFTDATSGLTTLRGAFAGRCSSLPVAQLLNPAGLGYALIQPLCASFGFASLTSADDIAGCLYRAHACAVDDLLRHHFPRLDALLQEGSVTLDTNIQFVCPATACDASRAAADRTSSRGH